MTEPVSRVQMVLRLAGHAKDKYIAENEEDYQLLERITFDYYYNMSYDELSKQYEEVFQPVSNY